MLLLMRGRNWIRGDRVNDNAVCSCLHNSCLHNSFEHSIMVAPAAHRCRNAARKRSTSATKRTSSALACNERHHSL